MHLREEELSRLVYMIKENIVEMTSDSLENPDVLCKPSHYLLLVNLCLALEAFEGHTLHVNKVHHKHPDVSTKKDFPRGRNRRFCK